MERESEYSQTKGAEKKRKEWENETPEKAAIQREEQRIRLAKVRAAIKEEKEGGRRWEQNGGIGHDDTDQGRTMVSQQDEKGIEQTNQHRRKKRKERKRNTATAEARNGGNGAIIMETVTGDGTEDKVQLHDDAVDMFPNRPDENRN